MDEAFLSSTGKSPESLIDVSKKEFCRFAAYATVRLCMLPSKLLHINSRPQICLWNQFKLAPKPLSFLCPFLDLMVSGENRNYPFMSI